jgi:transposase
MERWNRQPWLPRTRVQEVIPMKSKAYRGTAVNRVDAAQVSQGHAGQALTIGLDIGKYRLFAVARWPDGQFERPWLVANPDQLPDLVALLGRLRPAHALTVALEPSGTYGDPLRQALADAGVAVQRVSPKAAHDYAEVFDGVPSQHDGKDAAVVAELAALGKAAPWPYAAKEAWEQELAYAVEWMDAQRQIYLVWLGRLEALLARHWPELTRLLKVSSATVLRLLAEYGGPAALAADRRAAARLALWGKRFLRPEKVRQVLASAKATLGVRLEDIDRRRFQEYARQALAARREVRRSLRRLRALVRQQPRLQAQGRAVGLPTACVLWASLGDPRQYSSGPAYRKAMGLNLVEHSSGTYRGQLRISKRGQPRVRRWLYLAVLRLIRREGVRDWYRAQKRHGERATKKALVAVMRKLALALYRVAVAGVAFEPRRLFPGVSARPGPAAGVGGKGRGVNGRQ